MYYEREHTWMNWSVVIIYLPVKHSSCSHRYSSLVLVLSEPSRQRCTGRKYGIDWCPKIRRTHHYKLLLTSVRSSALSATHLNEGDNLISRIFHTYTHASPMNSIVTVVMKGDVIGLYNNLFYLMLCFIDELATPRDLFYCYKREWSFAWVFFDVIENKSLFSQRKYNFNFSRNKS